MNKWLMLGPAVTAAITLAGAADARPMVFGGKLPLTRGATSIEGGAGGGLSTWALIAGNETEDGVGASAFMTRVPLADYDFMAYGAALGFFDRVEFSLAHQEFDTGATGVALGLGEGFTFEQDIVGLKVRVLGDAVYDQDSWLPQIAVGVQYKQGEHDGLLAALGAEDDEGVDVYVAATKVVLNQSMVLNATVRGTRGNQFGLLGHGGDQDNKHQAEIEVSAAYMATDRLIIGGEYRTRPDNLGFAEEERGYDVFAAYALTENLTLVGGYVDLGSIATFDDQDGAYFSIQIGF